MTSAASTEGGRGPVDAAPRSGAARLWDLLVAPSGALAPDKQQRARFLSAMLLVLMPVTAVGTAIVLGSEAGWSKSHWVGVLVNGFVLGLYAASRSRFYTAVAMLSSFGLILIVGAAGAVEENRHFVAPFLGFTLIGIAQSSLLLRRVATFLAGLLSLALIALVALTNPVAPFDALIVLGIVVVLLTTLMMVSIHLRQGDIAIARRHKLSLQHSEAANRAILESALEAVISIDAQGLVTGWNARAEDMFGWSPADVIGERLSELIIPERFRLAHERGLQRFRETGRGRMRGRRIEIRALHREGREFPIELSISTINVGDRVQFTALVRDVTEQRRVEEELAAARDAALEASRMKSEFLANMSHEIRTPMNGVIGMTQLLLDTPLTPEQRDYAETVRNCGESLLTIINDILDFSKVEAGKLELDIARFDLREVLEEVLDLFAGRCHSKGLELSCFIDPAVHPTVAGDPGRLRQILINLIDNAVKFTESGEISVRADVVREDESAQFIKLSVRDTGIGISAEAQKRLFQPFTQADGSTTRRFGGTGLGLAICAQLTRLMGGDLLIHSARGEGSTFSFTARMGVDFGEVTITEDEMISLFGVRILVVDDQAGSRTSLEEQLRYWGAEVDSTGDGPTALQLIRKAMRAGKGYALVLVDFEMPGMDGLSLGRIVKQEQELADIPLLMLVPLEQFGQGVEARQAGFAGYLTKPVRHAQLRARMISVLGDRARPSTPALAALEVPARHRRARILVAEDNVVNQKLAVRMLERLGYEVDVTENGRQCLDAMSERTYDAILMDCQMPEMDGYEATVAIREREGEGRHTPIIALTAHALRGEREKCLSVGMDDYLAKPVKLERLRDVLTHWLDDDPEAPMPAEDPAPQGGAEVVDLSVLRALKDLSSEGAPSVVSEVIDLFLEDVPKDCAALHDAINRRNTKAVAAIAHHLKASCLNLGAQQMVQLCVALEERARRGSLEGTRELMADVDAEFERVRKLLTNERLALLS